MFCNELINYAVRIVQELVYDCVSISLFPRFCVATRRKQHVTIENFLSVASCLRSSTIGLR